MHLYRGGQESVDSDQVTIADLCRSVTIKASRAVLMHHPGSSSVTILNIMTKRLSSLRQHSPGVKNNPPISAGRAKSLFAILRFTVSLVGVKKEAN